MLIRIVFAIFLSGGSIMRPAERRLQDGTAVWFGVGVKEGVGVFVIVAEGVTVGVWVGVAVNSGVGVLVGVGVFVGVGVSVGVGEGVSVGVDGCHVDGGTVTWIATLTKTVRALSARMGSLGVSALERERKGTIFGTIGR
jgi:hypothetical protein